MRSESELPLDGGLHTIPIEEFALDLRRGDSFSTHQLDKELFVLLLPQVFGGPNYDTRTEQELFLGARNLRAIPGEVWPIGILPVPRHER